MLKQKTVYFREEDLPLWEAIKNKAEWLHNALNPSKHLAQVEGYPADSVQEIEVSKPIKTPTHDLKYAESETLINRVEGRNKVRNEVIKLSQDIPSFKPCKHGADPTTCKYAKVKNGVKKCRM